MKSTNILLATFLLISLLFYSNQMSAQKADSGFGIKFSGFVKNDIFFDTRQTVSARDGHFLLWPASPRYDELGLDVNQKSSFNFTAIQTRLTGKITGPDAFGAKTSGVIEGAFFGITNADINGFRLRHAYIKLSWSHSELLIGQYWHPAFVTDCFPGTVSFNTGVPFQPFSRAPQIRYVEKIGGFRFILAALSQLDFKSIGPAGRSADYLRNTGIPDLQAQVHFKSNDQTTGKEFVTGAGIGYKVLQPQLITGANYQTDQTVRGLSTLAFLKYKMQDITVKLEGFYGENDSELFQIGGFAVLDTIDVSKGIVSYTPTSSFSTWADMHTNGKRIQVGLFGGFAKNLGCPDLINGTIYGFGTDIVHQYRISPRIVLNHNKIRFASEIEYTSTTFGNAHDRYALPVDEVDVSNVRLLCSAYYFF